jgi:hypothetical protein
MSSRKPRNFARRLVKLASLGVAGLIAGLLTGCTSTSANLSQLHLLTSTAIPATTATVAYQIPMMSFHHSHLSAQSHLTAEQRYFNVPSHLRLSSPHARIN